MKLSDCLNWKVITGLLGVGVVSYVLFPDTIVRFAPFLVFLICPLSMLFMMKGMNSGQTVSVQADTADKKRTFTCPECLLKYEDKEWAEKCLVWCRAHHSCNIEITKHAKK